MRYLGMIPKTHEDWLKLMQQSVHLDAGIDCYNEGPLVTALEQRVSQLLGTSTARVFNKGTVCQLALLKTVCDARDNPCVALHRRSHIAEDEADAFIYVTGLKPLFTGGTDQPFNASDVHALEIKPAVLTVELPLRRVGFRLTPWDELVAMRDWCDEHHVHFHLDGARLWESTNFYQKSLPDIAGLFDSVYVSFYKGIGGLSGAALAGKEALLTATDVWRNRLGSQPYTQFPVLLTALDGLENNLPHIPNWVTRAKALALVLAKLEHLSIDSPHTNAFQLRLNGDVTVINQKLLYLQDQLQVVMCKPFSQLADGPELFTEIQIGDGAAHLTNQEVSDFFAQLNH